VPESLSQGKTKPDLKEAPLVFTLDLQRCLKIHFGFSYVYTADIFKDFACSRVALDEEHGGSAVCLGTKSREQLCRVLTKLLCSSYTFLSWGNCSAHRPYYSL